MPKVKIKEIKKKILVKEIKKEEITLEEEVKSEEFPSEEFIPSMHTPSIKSVTTVEEIVDRTPRIIKETSPEQEPRGYVQNLSNSPKYDSRNIQRPLQDGAGYDIAIQRSNFSQEAGVERQDNFLNTAEKINPSIRSSDRFESQGDRSNNLVSGSLADNSFNMQNQYDHDLNKKRSNTKPRLPWEM